MVRVLWVVSCVLWVTNLSAQEIQFESLNKLPASINTNCDEIMPMFSGDGKKLYFARVCPGDASDIWFSEFNPKTNNWGRPKNDKDVFNDRGNNAIVGMSADGQT